MPGDGQKGWEEAGRSSDSLLSHARFQAVSSVGSCQPRGQPTSEP